jgi:tyrosyl-DNA phosphodiesterase-1
LCALLYAHTFCFSAGDCAPKYFAFKDYCKSIISAAIIDVNIKRQLAQVLLLSHYPLSKHINMSKHTPAVGSSKNPVMIDDSDEEDEEDEPAKLAAAGASSSTAAEASSNNAPIEIIDDDDDGDNGDMERKPAAVSTSNDLPMSPRSQMRSIRDAAKQRWKRAKVESPEQGSIATAPPTIGSSTVAAKKPRIEGSQKKYQEESSGPQVPIKILTSEQPRPSNDLLHAKYCRTLRQLLGFDEGPEEIKCGIDWLVIFNYVVDFNYLLSSIPELVSIPKTIVFYGDGSDPHMWREACTLPSGKCTVEFCQLKPSDPAGSPTNPLKIRVPWGVHHTKMFLVGLANGSLRVIIMTANLLHNDVSLKTQGAYIQDFPLKTAATNRYASCEFEKDLVAYLRTYNYEQRQTWSSTNDSPKSFIDEIKRYDFSSAKVILIPSTPGRNKLDNPKGYLKLAKAIRQHVPKRSTTKPIICQFSSIGSLNAKWLKEIAQSWNVTQTECTEQQLQLVYPTVDEIRGSVEGYQGGGSVPGTIKNTSKPFLQPLYHKWSAPQGGTTNPLHKPTNVPHIKTFYQLTEDELGMEWFCLTSHNLSKAAWGEKIMSEGARRIFCRHWELGVLVVPQLLGGGDDCKLVPAGGASSSSAAKNHVAIPLPFPLKPTEYGASDRPWAVDGSY